MSFRTEHETRAEWEQRRKKERLEKWVCLLGLSSFFIGMCITSDFRVFFSMFYVAIVLAPLALFFEHLEEKKRVAFFREHGRELRKK